MAQQGKGAKARAVSKKAGQGSGGKVKVRSKGRASGRSRPAAGSGGKKFKKVVKARTGVVRLDELLQGGIKVPSAVALLGATHIGKEALMYHFLAEGLKNSHPVIIILTKSNTTEFRQGFNKVFPAFKKYEEKGYVRYIDLYSLTVGLKGKNPYANYIKGVERTNEILKVLSTLGKIYKGKSTYHRVLLNDLSAFHSKMGYAKTQDLVHAIIARSDSYNSLVLLDIIDNVHPDGEVKALEDGLEGTIHLKAEGDRFQLRVKGLGEPLTHDWVEYKFDESTFNLTGPFAMTRIH